MIYLAVAAVVFAVNLVPAFAPPTWAILVLFRLHAHVPAAALVAIGAMAASTGRLTLASATRTLRKRLPSHRVDRLEAVRARLLRRRSHTIAILVLFVLSPLPSAQLFVAAGLLDVPLIPATAAFFAGRVVSYAGYVGAAALVDRSYGDVATDALRSPLGLAVQIVLTVAVAALPFAPWPRGEHRVDPVPSERPR